MRGWGRGEKENVVKTYGHGVCLAEDIFVAFADGVSGEKFMIVHLACHDSTVE